MRKIFFITCLHILMIIPYEGLYARGAYTNFNQSVEYRKTQNRSASIDIDAVYFNPAGTVLTADGLYLYVSNQGAYRLNKLKGGSITKREYNSEGYSYLFPNLYLNYKKRNFAFSLGLLPISGATMGGYQDGLQMFDLMLPLMKNTLNSVYQQLGIGNAASNPVIGDIVTSKLMFKPLSAAIQANAAFSVLGNNRLAFSFGYRFAYSYSEIEAAFRTNTNFYFVPFGGDYTCRQDGTSHAVIIGISSRPVKSLTIGFTFEWNSDLKLKSKAKNDTIIGLFDSSFRDGGIFWATMPMHAALGVSYEINSLKIEVSCVYSFNQFAHLNGLEKTMPHGGVDAGIGLDYTFSSIPLDIGCGYNFGTFGFRPSGQNQLSPGLDVHSVSAGISYTFNKTTRLTFAGSVSHLVPDDLNKGTPLAVFPARYYSNIFMVGLGLELKVM